MFPLAAPHIVCVKCLNMHPSHFTSLAMHGLLLFSRILLSQDSDAPPPGMPGVVGDWTRQSTGNRECDWTKPAVTQRTLSCQSRSPRVRAARGWQVPPSTLATRKSSKPSPPPHPTAWQCMNVDARRNSCKNDNNSIVYLRGRPSCCNQWP